ncbi:asparagine synthase-related protein [Streptomyces sp. CBMA156]|uniref:asparagine synthase-related protein n=1 Tax=Streptomyces sp. CBMA156 TaxID=1930280 RepID=UPI001661B26C|nr:asparagine synthase-related protein [Streptomyces sp. CBMA156]
MSGHRRTGFVVLPDTDAGAAVAAVWGTAQRRALHHPSGRPWILGHWPSGEAVTAQAGPVALAVLGTSDADPHRLRHHAERSRDPHEALAAAHDLAGSFHLLATAHGTVAARGTLSGLRRLHLAEIDGVPVLADRADVLAAAAGLTPSTDHLALRLAHPLPHPADTLPLWPGITPVPPHHTAELAPHRPARTTAHWHPPAPVRPPAEAATALGQALRRAVDTRTRGGGLVAADLSGGLDSTPLCFLAATGPADLLTVTLGSLDPRHDDAVWAERAAHHLPGKRLVLPAEDLPAMFAGIDTPGPQGDEPFAWTRTRARDEAVARLLADHGARLRISGEGGDEVLQALPAYLRTLLARHPATAARHLRGHRARLRWKLPDALRALTDPRPYPAWLAHAAERLTHPHPPGTTQLLGWGIEPRLPPWATAHAADLAREQLRALRDTRPLAPEHAQHQVLHMVRHSASAMRQLTDATARAGVPYSVPLLDDRVLDACLAADPATRGTPFAYKPLLTAAVAPDMPADLLRRTGKGDFTPDTHQGLARHRAGLAALIEDSALVRAGLVDPDTLRRACLGLYPPGTPYAALDATLACEHWLRAHATSPHPHTPPGTQGA